MPDTKTQNYSNHARYVPMYHFVLTGAWLVLLAYQLYNLWRAPGVVTALGVVMTFVLLGALLYARIFALAAQDRLIRLEERMRLDRVLPADHKLRGRIDELTVQQLIGLRFASDEELPELAHAALNEVLSQKAIKQRIQNWRPDHCRV
ncbi:MAG: DUF6526 family protein [Acidobacteriota bacterium]